MLDARLGEQLGARIQGAVAAPPPLVSAAIEVAREPLPSAEAAPSPSGDEEGAVTTWPDDAAESSFLAEARTRGEAVTPPKAREEVADDTDTQPLPPLNELVERIPVEVREVLEDLFRARFVKVKRLPKSALKS